MNAGTRKRSRLACRPCRDRKRKCDGSNPCTTCISWGYECHYEPPRRKFRDLRGNLRDDPRSRRPECAPKAVPAQDTADTDDHGLVQRLEANSGAAFVRNLGLRIDPDRAPRLSLFGWNVGSRRLSIAGPGTGSALPVTEIASLEHMRALARVYFDKVDPCYGFIDRQLFFQRLDRRWQQPPPEAGPGTYDAVLAGVAALGCLFSLRHATVTEVHLVATAVSVLHAHPLGGPPPTDLLTAWTLRSIYLRLTDSPHSTWIASCTLMHLIEASGIHPDSHPVLPPSARCDPDTRARLVGVARHLNVWTSFDLGLSRVAFRGDDVMVAPSSSPPGDYTAEILNLLPLSISLDPERSRDEADLSAALSRVLDGAHTQPPSVLAQCNLALCILRRIHSQKVDIPPALAGRVLALLKKGLGCARSMVVGCAPWHHVANVPFQTVCVLLVMDVRASLAMLPDAMETLSLVASTYDTETTREAYGAARLLVLLHQQRRKDDLAILDTVLSISTHHQQEGQVAVVPAPQPSPQPNPSAEEYSWLESLVADLPGLQGVDLDQFLYSDVINYPAPVGCLRGSLSS